jgi:Transglutaminase-like superfamily
VSSLGHIDYAAHSAYSDPGRWAGLLDALPVDAQGLSAVSRNVIAHYRANADELPEATRDEINLRWLEKILGADQGRSSQTLEVERPMSARVQGCCRDHTLFCIGALRQHGIPARSRVGFASYFEPDWNHDHVVVEAWRDDRWVRFDPELAPGNMSFDPLDMPVVPRAPFVTAAEAWEGHRAGRLDVETYGVGPGVPVRGEWFVGSYVVMELAHRLKDELLLWDGWGVMGPDVAEHSDLLDELAALLIAADRGDAEVEARLVERYRTDPRLHPADVIQSVSPYDGSFTEVRLTR